MKIDAQLTDQAILQELGGRLAAARIERDLTQAALAEQAGVSKRTVERLESGKVATQLSGFLRVCRTLGLIERLDTFLSNPAPSPMAQLKHQGRQRQRVTGKKSAPAKPKKWSWGEPS
jgi:transcriptional regulator with XRE-family HTH domain